MVRLSDRPDMTLDVYRGRKTTIQQTKTKQTLDDKIVKLRLRNNSSQNGIAPKKCLEMPTA